MVYYCMYVYLCGPPIGARGGLVAKVRECRSSAMPRVDILGLFLCNGTFPDESLSISVTKLEILEDSDRQRYSVRDHMRWALLLSPLRLSDGRRRNLFMPCDIREVDSFANFCKFALNSIINTACVCCGKRSIHPKETDG